MSIKRSIVIGEPKTAGASTEKKKKEKSKSTGTTITGKIGKKTLTPVGGIVRDKSVLQTSMPP